jgi:MFS family permease
MSNGEAVERALQTTWRGLRAGGRVLRGEVVRRVGGPARAQVIAAFAAVLALSSADSATVGAVAPQLERSLHIDNTQIGLLSSVALLVGAVFVLPVGLLVDRAKRMPLLAASVALWSVASLFSGLASSYSGLLFTRLALGAVTATAGPAIASLTGDYFPARERGSVYAYILGGEVAGTAVGFVVSGTLASVISWRAAFVALAIPGFFLARLLWRTIPEPLRGGQSRLEPGVEDLDAALASAASQARVEGAPEGEAARADELAQSAARERGVRANRRLVLTEDPQRMSFSRAVRYMFSIPTYLLMIISSSLGYFFFAGLQTFAILFVRGHYRVGQVEAELVVVALVAGALVGTLVSGRLTDLMLRRGMLNARVWVPAVCYLGAAVLLVPGFLGENLTPALWFDIGGAALISAANPPLDAARLDIMVAGLWGRAESVRTFLRSLTQALAPVLFGGLADLIAGIAPSPSPIGTHPGAVSISTGTGLQLTFLIMLIALAFAGVFLIRAQETYPSDVATAAASAAAGSRSSPREPSFPAPAQA